jgi:hypothetical protein
MNLNDMLAQAQKGAKSPRNSERIRTDSWLIINGEEIPIYDMSDKNLLGSIKGVLSSLPSRFLIEWDDTMGLLGDATGNKFSKAEKMDSYRAWLGANWFKHIPRMILTMLEEAYDRELNIRIGESKYAEETEKFMKSLLESDVARAKTDTQIKI